MTITITAFERSPDGGKGLARDTRVRWALEEVRQPYEVRLVSFSAMKEPAHLKLRDPDKAIANGLRVAGTFYGRGVCYERKGKRDEAIADYRRALAEPAFATYDKDAHKLARERLTALGADKGPSDKKTP